jgi:hypothetical protein
MLDQEKNFVRSLEIPDRLGHLGGQIINLTDRVLEAGGFGTDDTNKKIASCFIAVTPIIMLSGKILEDAGVL